jgi:DnaJ-domain-containing protein 1
MAYYVISHKANARLISMKDGTLGFESTYDPDKTPAFVAALKAAIPYSDRRWDRDQKLWMVAPQHANTLADLAEEYLGVRPQIPAITSTAVSTTQLLQIKYIGAAKERAGGQRTASGWCNGSWTVIFPESTLKSWFAVDETPESASTLYAVLGVAQAADAAKLKKAYRAAARQWHPDVCKEDGAEEQFKRINAAYQILSDPLQRRKYDAGLALAASVGQQEPKQFGDTWRPPLRCGYILCNGQERLGRFVVSEILAWEDIVDNHGRTLVTSWRYGDDRFTERWV